MKKRIISLAAVLVLLVSIAVPCAFAESNNYTRDVTFNGKAITGFNGSVLDIAGDFQPGDELTVRVTLNNNCDTATDWYINNSVIDPFEDSALGAEYGSYTYRLTYNGIPVYESGNIGGEGSIGIQEAVNSLNKNDLVRYAYLGKIPAYGKGEVVLYMAIDGETQNNDYQRSLAELQLAFAVDKNNTYHIPKTSDKGDFIIWGGATLICAGLAALIVVKDRKKDGDKA